MSREGNMHRSQLLVAAAVAFSAAGMVTVPAPVQAKPMVPLAPACVQYGWPGPVGLIHTNGWYAAFSAAGPKVNGPAWASPPGGGDRMYGTVFGEISGRNVRFTIRWPNGAVGEYTGMVGDDGNARGDTVDVVHPENKAAWNTDRLLQCVKTADSPPDPQPPQQAPPPDRPVKDIGIPKMRVKSAVDVWDKPEHEGGQKVIVNNEVLFLEPGRLVGSVNNQRCQGEIWCEVTVAEAPGGQGWVWGEHLELPVP